MSAFRLTLVHPCIGRRPGEAYIKTWQMESLPLGVLAGLTPPDVEVRFYDDRTEAIDYEEPTDLVAISIETYTAKRAYQIASEFRRRGVPVVMGGFHASLVPDEVERYAESVVVGEAEHVWAEVIDDWRAGTPKKRYTSAARPSLVRSRPDRTIFEGKRYLPIGLVEVGRGCAFKCDFCAIQTVFRRTQTRRPHDDVLSELAALKGSRKLFFFVDDNFATHAGETKEFLRALAPLQIRWVSQMAIPAAHDEEMLALMAASGCMGVLIGFESLDPVNLAQMDKGFNTMAGGYAVALANLRRHQIRLYGTFIFGYDADHRDSFSDAVAFAREHAFYIAAFNHLTPFPGTPLYERLQLEGRLRYESWWLDPEYSYNTVPFRPAGMAAAEVERGCVAARAAFYSRRSILARGFDAVNRSNGLMWRNFWMINQLHRADVRLRDKWPLGDQSYRKPLLEAAS
ncbi:MAG: B12-binding domain-containing radical SAM protein [Myxococcales bacterium]|nr:B12-binding domain-containing radical SAM protein [Myxococcales bacterium]